MCVRGRDGVGYVDVDVDGDGGFVSVGVRRRGWIDAMSSTTSSTLHTRSILIFSSFSSSSFSFFSEASLN